LIIVTRYMIQNPKVVTIDQNMWSRSIKNSQCFLSAQFVGLDAACVSERRVEAGYVNEIQHEHIAASFTLCLKVF
jgi:hypothetical protein